MATANTGLSLRALIAGQTLVGSSAGDFLYGFTGATIMSGGLGDDTYYISSAANTVIEAAGGGTDKAVTWIDYTLAANIENLFVNGDMTYGVGNNLANVITGGAGRQQLFGAGGDDTLIGGAGKDDFIVRHGNGSDTILDFTSGEDTVQLGNYGFKTLSDVLAHMSQQGSNVVLQLDDNETLTFSNHTISDFKTGDFRYSLDLSNFKQTFADEFNSLSFQSDGGIWRTDFYDGPGGRDNSSHQSKQVFMDKDYLGLGVDPFSVNNGVATIHAGVASDAVKDATGFGYTSGMLSSRGTFSQTYGYFEIRCEMPAQQGTWPAFWLLPANGDWPPELDVFENLGNDKSKIYMTSHTEQTGTHTYNSVSSWVGDVTEGMHTYGVLWTEKELVWYVDGAEAYRMPTPDDMHQPMYMIANMAIGGDWSGDPNSSFKGADLNIDYIHAYQLDGGQSHLNIIQSAASITLDAVADGLVLTGKLDINGIGNALDNTLTGNSGNNVLDGRAGADVMTGGAGNDVYYVDNFGDKVVELTNGGTDKIVSSINFALGANIEQMSLSGSGNINAVGNELNNTLTGNSGSNVLDGRAGADTMIGGTGNDTYYVDNAGDVVTEYWDQGNDTVFTSISYSASDNVDVITLTGSSDFNITGNSTNNVLSGNAGDNILNGGAGADTMMGGYGNDQYYVDNTGDVVTEWWNQGADTVFSTVTYAVGDNVENLTLIGSASVNATGNSLINVLTGNSGSNTLDGLGGADTMIGGAGNDRYYVENYGDKVVESANQGTDTVLSTVTYTLTDNVENLTLLSTTNINATGNDLNNVLTGNIGDNTLDGLGGNDTMIGGLGNDRYYVDSAADVITEYWGQGTDTVYAAISYVVSDNIENITLTGSSDINATGNSISNVLVGNSGDNILNGGAGVDTMTGGWGNDQYYVENAGDIVNEYYGQGTDTVNSTISYTAGINIENVTLMGGATINVTGNALVNVLTGNYAANTLDGLGGADTMIGGAGNDRYYVENNGDKVVEDAAEGIDTVLSTITYALAANVENLTLLSTTDINATGNDLNNILTGNIGDNRLDGRGGADTMIGGLGNDSYYVDNSGDVITEYYGQGTDSVFAAASYVLSDNIENITLTGGGDINATGNGLGNILNGNNGDNILNGSGGADTMTGGLGNDQYYVDNAGDVVNEYYDQGTDTVYSTISYTAGNNIENLTLIGGASVNATGNDLVNVLTGNYAANTLDGLGGADTMAGGQGNDRYYVDNTGDKVVENAGEGTDIVFSSVSYKLASNVENLTLAGTSDIDATGNELNNVLTGNSGDNSLNGLGGADTMIGGYGNDQYTVDNSGDVVTEYYNQGVDSVYSSASYALSDNIENLTLTGDDAINATGNGLANTLTGNAGENVLTGGGGADTIYGGDGDDILIGGAGMDILTGGKGRDVFVYNAATDMGAANRDTITDFSDGDVIDLSNVYGGTLSFLGSAGFTGHAGEVRLSTQGDDVMVYIDVGGDKVSDMQILLSHTTIESLSSTGGDFIL